jgi:acyl-coenzyme A synthetase/AMP-(fatty) acid ligase/acyl carrier protein
MYGTTETHIALHWDVPVLPDDYEELIPIGKGCSHVDVMAVNPQGEQVKAGESGELVIRGPSLMEGYWHLPERNAKALIRHRFSPELEALCYHTGDLVQQMPDGNYYIIGRGDRRVKVRGNLVDLDEVEQVLLTHSQVQEAAAFTVSTDDDTAWVEAAIIPKPHNNPTSSELRVHVSRTLPTYAVPEKVRVVADFPRTGSGKMSRKDLQIAAQQELSEQSYPQDGDLKDTIKRYILTEILDDSGQTKVEDDTELLESGLMDSIGVVRLVAFLEDNSGVKVPNDEFIAENFSSLSAISNLVERLRVLR